MFEIIKDIIVKWDPIGLMEFAPPDEYDNECHLIFEALIKKQASLGKIIYDVFIDNFGEEFQVDLAKCMDVAAEIENRVIGS